MYKYFTGNKKCCCTTQYLFSGYIILFLRNEAYIIPSFLNHWALNIMKADSSKVKH